MKRTLVIMRHAKSSWDHKNMADHDRPLNSRGEKDAPRMGRFLAREGIRPDVVLSSTALRARCTAAAVVEAAGWDVSIVEKDGFYQASEGQILSQLASLSDAMTCAMVVGHNPTMTALLWGLTNDAPVMSTAAVAEIHLDAVHWGDIRLDHGHSLKNHWYPKGLPADFT